MKRMLMLSSLALCLPAQAQVQAQSIPGPQADLSSATQIVHGQRQGWLDGLRQVLRDYPRAGSEGAEWDRLGSLHYRAIDGERMALARADASESTQYKYRSFISAALGTEAASVNLLADQGYTGLARLVRDASSAYDEKAGRLRSNDFILKDFFLRGRPRQVLDENGNYLPDYEQVAGSSFPSGHSWEGYRQGVTLAMIFPERGDEIYARALQYAESRVILGAHFPTDTIASRIGMLYAKAQMLADDDIRAAIVGQAMAIRARLATSCNMPLRQCLAQQATPIGDGYRQQGDQVGYYGQGNPSATRLSLDQVPDQAAHLLRLRFPYLSHADRLAILAGTAYAQGSLADWLARADDASSRWGLINLPAAHRGPNWLYGDMTVRQTVHAGEDIAEVGRWDVWQNDLSGPGRLYKQGEGTLVLAGNNSFGGLSLSQGRLVLTGSNALTALSVVDGGELVVDGTLTSPLQVNQGGIVSGSGTIGALRVGRDGTLMPGHSIGVLRMTGDLEVDASAVYRVDVSRDGRSDEVRSDGRTRLEGGRVEVALENQANLLTRKEVEELAGQRYAILSAAQGVEGRFTSVAPNFLFMGTRLDNTPDQVWLHIGRNDVALASAATTDNQRAVAAAIDKLPTRHAVHQSILALARAQDASVAFANLDGQVHADVASMLLDQGAALRDNISMRFTQPQGPWVQAVGQWQRRAGDRNTHNARGYSAQAQGLQLGMDALAANGARFGVAASYTTAQSSPDRPGAGTDSDYGSASARSESIQLGIYGARQWNDIALRSSLHHAWHGIQGTRAVRYDVQQDDLRSRYRATGLHLLAEVAYRTGADTPSAGPLVEPFLMLRHDRLHLPGFTEHGGAAALQASGHTLRSTTSTLGLRGSHQWSGPSAGAPQLRLLAETGWSTQLGSRQRQLGLQFADTDASFTVASVPAARHAVHASTGLELRWREQASVSAGYSARLAAGQQDHGAHVRARWQF